MTLEPDTIAAIASDFRTLEHARLVKALERDLNALDSCVLGKPAAQRIARRLRTRVRKLSELVR